MKTTLFLEAADLYGREAISYARFSSAEQRHGSSLERQDGVLREVVDRFQLKLAHGFEDRGLSGSTGAHRKRGELRHLLEMIALGQVSPGTVFVIEAMHRLSREGATEVWPILAELVNKGIVLVTGYNMKIWCHARMNSSENHELQAAINTAREYAENLSYMAKGAHASRRRKMASGEAVVLNGKMLGWLTRKVLPDGTREGYSLNAHADTVMRIYREAGEGASVRAIVDGLNGDQVPIISGIRAEWTVPRVGAILRDRHVLGLHTPMRRKARGRPDILGPERKVFPAAITMAAWDKARAMMESKPMLTGRPGTGIPNLFTGKAFCRACNAPMRVDTGGGLRKGVRRKDFICSRYIESKMCGERARYSLHHFERPILTGLIEMARFAPKTASEDTAALDEEIGALRVDIEDRKTSLETLRPRMGRSATYAEQFYIIVDEVDALQRRRDQLEAKRGAARHKNTRLEDTWRLMQEIVAPALNDDASARDRLRGMLAPLDFRVVPDEAGGLALTFASITRHIETREQADAGAQHDASFDHHDDGEPFTSAA